MSVTARSKDRYRQRYEIFYDMLLVSTRPINKTRIMANCYISYAQLKKYLKELTDLGLIGYTNVKKHEDQVYKTTENGIDYIKTFEKLHNMAKINNKNKNEEEEILAT